MEVEFTLNGKLVYEEIADDTTLFQLLRRKACYSVKCGCETENCGLCTVLVNGKSRLSCSFLAARANGCEVVTLEGVEKEAKLFGTYLAEEGVEQ
ncbi:MAG: 2Fe-2S iron-sulfur cluster binding domain-containing protein, partial [Hungatella sp.]|nr:2Fe-2S iron-sulfur cluster binding domain-containing protein [Hungatella sp.]